MGKITKHGSKKLIKRCIKQKIIIKFLMLNRHVQGGNMNKFVTKRLKVWLEYPHYFSYAFCILLLLSVMINGPLLIDSALIGLYHLTIIAGGIAFWNKIWIQGIISGFVLFLRYYLDSNEFPHLSIFLFSWFTYFLITYIASIPMRNHLHTKKKSMDVIFALAKSLDSRRQILRLFTRKM